MTAAPVRRYDARQTRLRASVLLGGAALSLLLGGCATAAPQAAGSGPAPSAAGATEPTAGESLSGVGPTAPFPAGLDLEIPEGTRSATIEFECSTGRFQVELGDSMMLGQSPVSGTCGEAGQMSWPVTEQTAPVLHIMVDEGVEWTAEARFSPDDFTFDQAITADCKAFSLAYSALFNADTGYSHYQAFDAAEWTTRVDDAAAQLGVAAAASTSALGEQFSAVQGIVADPARVVGSALAGTETPIGLILQACDANQTPVVTTAEFGG